MSIFNCINCQIAYNKSNNKPKSLPCGHVFCEECVSTFIYKDIKGLMCKCPIDKIIHKNLNLFKIPVCVQILDNLPLKSNEELNKEIKDYLIKVENQVQFIKNQFNSYKKFEENIINYFNEQRNKINFFFELVNKEIEKKKTLLSENVDIFFKKHNSKIERNKHKIGEYISKLNEMNYNKILFQIKDYDSFLKEKLKIDNDLNEIKSFINKNINNESQNNDYPLFNEPNEISIPNNIFGELKIINKNFKNEKNDENKLDDDTQTEVGNVTNIFNHNLYNEIQNLKTPIKNIKNKIHYFFSENSIHKNTRNELSLNEIYSINISEKILSSRKRILSGKRKKEKSVSNFSVPKKFISKNRYSNKNLNKFENDKTTINIKSVSQEKNNNDLSLIGNNFRLYKEKNLKNEKNKQGFITIENQNKRLKRKNLKDNKKLIINKSILNMKNSFNPSIQKNNLKIFSSRFHNINDSDINNQF